MGTQFTPRAIKRNSGWDLWFGNHTYDTIYGELLTGKFKGTVVDLSDISWCIKDHDDLNPYIKKDEGANQPIVSGCANPLASNKGTSGVTDHDKYNGIKVLIGTVSFRIAPDGVREIVLHAKNNTKNNLWVPHSSMGFRGMSGAEAVNLREIGPESMKSIHHDYSLCKFPDQYEMLKPGQSWEHIHALPNDFRGEIEISVWAPLRTRSRTASERLE